MELTFLKNDVERKNFLNNFWNKKHQHVTNGVKDLFVLDKDQLDELLQDEQIESRAVVHKNQRKLTHGSFNKQQIDEIKKHSHTFIIHNLNLIFEELNILEKQFSFLPNWIFDDIMCTYSNSESSLGAHYDPYNVMIIQARGKRKWELQYNYEEELKEDEDIKVIKNFKSEFEIILNPGDVLFIPRGCAHRGSSIEDSLSYSVGFKAIELNKLLQAFYAQEILNNEQSNIIDISDFNQEMDNQILEEFVNNIQKLASDKTKIKSYLLKHLTRNKVYEPEIVSMQVSFEDEYYKIADFKWSYTEDVDLVLFSINSEVFKISKSHFYSYFLELLEKPTLELFKFPKSESEEIKKLINQIISLGFIEISDT